MSITIKLCHGLVVLGVYGAEYSLYKKTTIQAADETKTSNKRALFFAYSQSLSVGVGLPKQSNFDSRAV